MDSDAADISAYSGKRAIIRKIREQTARRRLLLRQQERILMACARLFVRQRLQDGILPQTGGPVVVGNPARDGYSSACGGTLRIRQLVMRISAREAGPVLSLHAGCFALWDAEGSKL